MAAELTFAGKAKKILGDNNYMALATSDKGGRPWAAVVFFAYDDDYNFYFLSAKDARHSENIMENPEVAAVIFDSRQPLGMNEDVQFEGEASVISDNGELAKAIDVYSKRLEMKSGTKSGERYKPEFYSGASEFRFFMIRTRKIYTIGPERRVEVDMDEEE